MVLDKQRNPAHRFWFLHREIWEYVFQNDATLFIIGICQSREIIDLRPLSSGLWRPIREQQSLLHLEQMKNVAGLLARHTVYLWGFFFSAFTRCVSSYCASPCFTVCLQASLSLEATFRESVFMPSAWRAHLHMSLNSSWGVSLYALLKHTYFIICIGWTWKAIYMCIFICYQRKYENQHIVIWKYKGLHACHFLLQDFISVITLIVCNKI